MYIDNRVRIKFELYMILLYFGFSLQWCKKTESETDSSSLTNRRVKRVNNTLVVVHGQINPDCNLRSFFIQEYICYLCMDMKRWKSGSSRLR